MKANKGKRGIRLGGKKNNKNIEQKADVEADVEVNDDAMKNSKDDVYISSQLKQPMLASSVEPLVDIPESPKSAAELNRNYKGKLRNFKTMKQSSTLNEGMEQSSTLNQAKNQKTMMTTIDTAGRSILEHHQRKQQSLTAGNSIQVEESAQMQHSTSKQAKNQKTMMTTTDTAGRSILEHHQRKQQSLTAGSPIQVAGSAQMQHSTSKQAKNQKTLMTTKDNAVRSILKRDQRKQQPLTAGSSIQVAGSAQIQPRKRDHRPVGRSQLVGLSNNSAQFRKDLVDNGSSKKQKTTPKIPSVSVDDYFKRNKQQLEVDDDINYENDDGYVEGDINYENDDGENTNDTSMKEMRKSKDDVYNSSQFKRPMLPSSGELLEDIPESIKWMFLKESFSKQGMEQSSTSKQATNQKTRMSTIDPAGRSILKHDQWKQCSTLKQAKNQKTTMSAVDSDVRSIIRHDQRKQHSTLKQAKNQKITMSAVDSAVRSILMHELRKQQSLTAGSSIQVAGSAQMQHKKQDHRPVGRSQFVGLSNSSFAQFQKDLVDHGPSKKQKKLPAMSLDDYFKMNKLPLEVEGDINYENVDGDVEGDVNYENDDGEKTNDNPMEGEASKKRKRGRGRTLCSKIHDRSLADRQEISLNEEGEPIGPTQKIVSEFSNFLGSVARMSDLCPLTYTNWKAIPNKKENIWAYVNKRYIVPENGEKAVYAIINDAWRRYKCFIKRNHFTKYDNLRERMKNRPDNIPEADFRKLMNYWGFETIQEISHVNAKSVAKQKCRHRAGPISFAIIREKLRATKDDSEPPTQAEVFIETRQSKRGNQLDQVTSNTITNLQDLIVNSGQSSDEAFRTLFGKEKPGRVRCHGRVTTPSLLKRTKEIGEIKKKHAIEVKNLNDKIQEMEIKHEKMEEKHSKEMAAMEAKLQVLLRFMLNQSNSNQDMGDLVALLSTPNDDNNVLHSSTSGHALNNHEVNHGLMDEEQLSDDLEEGDEEQPFDDLEDDEQQRFDDLEEDDEEQSFDDLEDDEEYSD